MFGLVVFVLIGQVAGEPVPEMNLFAMLPSRAPQCVLADESGSVEFSLFDEEQVESPATMEFELFEESREIEGSAPSLDLFSDVPVDRLVHPKEIPQPKGYPVRAAWWTGCGSWQHMTQGQHAGKFDAAWLRSLSWQELQSLHSDDHEGRVQWSRVVRPSAVVQVSYRPKLPQSVLPSLMPQQGNCPGGRCPVKTKRKGKRR